MDELDRREREKIAEHLKDARTCYNQHSPSKKESMDVVAKAIGISKSIIQNLEDEDNDRGPSYLVIRALAKHYGVPADYLLGLSDEHNIKKIAVDELGLSSEAVRNIEDAKRSADNDPYFRRRHDILNGILSDRHFKIFLSYFANAEIAAEKARAAKEQSDAVKKTHCLPENGDYIKEKDAYSYHKYRCIKEFGKMLDNFCKAEGLDD